MTPLESRVTLGFDEWAGIVVLLVLYAVLPRPHLRGRWRVVADFAVFLTFLFGWAFAVYVRGYPMHEAHEQRWLMGQYPGCAR